MFPKSAVIMVLVAALMLLTATAIDAFSGRQINQLYLGLGVVLIIFSTAMLLFKRR
jgi:hypothetical protein